MPWSVQSFRDALHSEDAKQVAEIVSAQIRDGRGRVNYRDYSYILSYTMLILAVEEGIMTAVQLLLKKGADVNITGGQYGTALIAAICCGHKDILQLLLKKGADVNITGGKYRTALIAAAYRERKDIVQLLLEKGADVNITGGKYGTALIVAAAISHYKSRDIVQLLLKKGADVNITGGEYGTALIAAANCGYKDIVQLLLKKGADVNITGGEHGTALIAAANRGQKNIVQLLLEKGADVNIPGSKHGPALTAAANSGDKDIVQLLLEKGADINLITSGKHGTALIGAANRGHKDIVQLLLEKGADVNIITSGEYGTALIAAANSGDKDIVQLLLEKGADINLITSGKHGTALIGAANRGHKDIVQLLLEKGADVNIITSGEYGTALIAAANSGDKDIVQLLLKKGADINITGGEYGSALVAATCIWHRDIVQLLLEKGADVNITSSKYGTALTEATFRKCKDTVRLLLEKGADANIIFGLFGTALITAIIFGYKDIVQLLLEKGADVNITGGEYGTALIAAIYCRHKNIVQLLLEKGADVNITGGQYRTALIAAAYHGHTDIVQLLLEKRADNIVQLLLEKGADVNITSGDHGTALIAATYFEHKDIVQLLLEKGADVNITGGEYNNALTAAVYKVSIGGDFSPSETQLGMVFLLLHAGADPNPSDSGDWGMNPKYKYGSLRWSLLGVALHVCDNLSDQSPRPDDLALMLLLRGAEFNTLSLNAAYLAAVRDLATREQGAEMVSLIFKKARDVNKMDAESWTLLGQAVLQMDHEMTLLLLNEGADINLGGGEYGAPLGMAIALSQGDHKMVELLLKKGADINKEGGKYGAPISVAFALGSEEMISLVISGNRDTELEDYGSILSRAALYQERRWHIRDHPRRGRQRGPQRNRVDVAESGRMRVGGCYQTALGTYPTALDAAASSTSSDDTGLLTLLTEHANAQEQALWPPFPMPHTGILEGGPATSEYTGRLQTAVRTRHTVFRKGDALTPDQAQVTCQGLDEEVLLHLLRELVGLGRNTLERHKVWIGNDIRYFVTHGFDLGLAYAAARVAWNDLKGKGRVARNRQSWLERAEYLDKARAAVITRDSAGQELIKEPYEVMPRQSNRVVAYSMLHAKTQATHQVGNSGPAPAPTRAPFWAISHSWTDDMEAVDTPINCHQWPVPLPRTVSLKGVRNALLELGAEYVWLDVLCLRQQSHSPSHQLKQDEWKLDVPTIGNIYRAAERVVRYFNGLGIPFTECGWDNSRHWLRRAWTLQEIKTENTTHNGGVVRANILNTKGMIAGKNTTLRRAIRPVLRLASEVDSPDGCSVYELAREMAKRYATQPTDKVAGLLYLLRTRELPTYDESITSEAAWAKCIPLLPLERKVELLFDFPYGGLLQGGWFPTWKQVLEWPERDPELEHTRTLLQKDRVFKLAPTPGTRTLPTEFICKIWAISNVFLQETGDPNDYEVKIADKVFGFYPPYSAQEPINISNDQPFTLTAMSLGHSYNWVVCEHIGERNQRYKSVEKDELNDVNVLVLRKIGVLRTDSCSELLTLSGEYKLAEFHSVFV
ncbi:ankyrin repeat-containing domain protein [Terfezia claveryi]|nr:ankyrin repeat-containing domain protein [Terfezia claveryi]